MTILLPDILHEVFLHLTETDPISGEYRTDALNHIYQCILVNREWCKIAIPILWKQPFHFGLVKSMRVTSMYLKCLNGNARDNLIENGIDIDRLIERSMALSFITNSSHPQFQPMFPYPKYIRTLMYESLLRSVRDLLSDEEADEEETDDENDNINDQIKLIMRSLLQLSMQQGASLCSLWIYPGLKNDYDLYQVLEEPECMNLVKNVKHLEIHGPCRRDDLFTLLGRICHQVESLCIDTLWSRHAFEKHIERTGECIASLISSQRSLRYFRLSVCKGYTRIFFPALASHTSTLRQISFDQVDFKDCGEWTSISECKNLELLEVTQCSNLTAEMIRPLINDNTENNGSSSPDKTRGRFGENFEVRYIRIRPFCKEFEDFANRFNSNRQRDVVLPFQLDEARNRSGK
ncbi:7335_t:CDS:2 [Funneliformis caledonium]|uniref:7335_t:CDS:1 n=1 Tax=Funneliformis caledonium TaxID=1117310 RepID=A0A9N9BZK8_9GLOM|nr:7335_t:CDS:2 [Funneliformis caledonium]